MSEESATADEATAHDLTSGRSGRSARAGDLVAGLSVITLLVVVLVRGWNLWFASDDWNIITEYTSGNLLVPFNGHLSLVPVAIYQALFHTVGIVDYLPYRLAGLVALAVLGWWVVRYGRRRIGPWTAALLVTAVLWNCSGSTNLMFPFLMNFSLPIAALIAIWWHLDRDSARDDVAAGLWLAFALATSGLGIMALGATVVELAVGRSPWRRWCRVLPGAVLWFVWWVTHRAASTASTDVRAVIGYSARMFLGGTTSVAFGWRPGGIVLAVGFLALVTVAAVRWRSLDARSLGALAAPAAFIGFTALTRIDIVPRIPPDELRYGWTVGAYLLLAAVALWRPTATDAAALHRLRTPAVAGAVLVLALSMFELQGGLTRWIDDVEGNTPGVRTNLFATEAVGADRVDPSIVMPLSFVPVTTGRYLAAVAELGSPIDGAPASDFAGRADQLDAADRVLRDSLSVEHEPDAGDPAPSVGCVESLTADPGSSFTLRAGTTGMVQIRRFGTTPVFELDAGAAGRYRLPADEPTGSGARAPYTITVDTSTVSTGTANASTASEPVICPTG